MAIVACRTSGPSAEVGAGDVALQSAAERWGEYKMVLTAVFLANFSIIFKRGYRCRP